ncbi:glycosyltransferase family 4 protein [Candidatus Uhrbacteria bacterium]|nr:glycosyltransferase family 4 protein [Candidatus Uhrbacteria bacterium]
MRIAQIVSTFPPYTGGMGNVAFQYAHHLSIRGHQVEVFKPSHWPEWSDRYKHYSTQVGYKFKVHRLPTKWKYGNAAWIGRPYLENFDLVHFHYPFVGAESVLKTSKPLILTYHMDLISGGWKGILFDIYQKLYLSRFLKKAGQVIFTSQDYLEHSRAARHNKFKEKFSSVPLGVSDDFVRDPQASPSQFWAKKNISAEKVMLFVGALDQAHAFKGINVLMEAFKRANCQNLALVIVGDGDMKSAYQAQAKDIKNIHFVGRVSQEELPLYYQNCDFSVLPSLNSSEAFGLVILEAMACGKPVIASALPGVRTLVKSGEDGLLVQPGNVQDLAEKIKAMLNMNCREMGNRAAQKIESQYRWPVIIDRIEEIYEKVVPSRVPARLARK